MAEAEQDRVRRSSNGHGATASAPGMREVRINHREAEAE